MYFGHSLPKQERAGTLISQIKRVTSAVRKRLTVVSGMLIGWAAVCTQKRNGVEIRLSSWSALEKKFSVSPCPFSDVVEKHKNTHALGTPGMGVCCCFSAVADLFDRHGLDLKQGPLGQSSHLYAGAGWSFAGEVLGIDGVDSRKIVDIGQKYGGLHHVAALHSGS